MSLRNKTDDTKKQQEQDEDKEQKILFLSDHCLNQSIRDIFTDFNHRIVDFSNKKFLNLTIEQVYEKEVGIIWIDLRDTDALEWTSKNLKTTKDYEWFIILVTNNKKQKFVDDLEDYIDQIIDLKDLSKSLLTLNFEDFLTNVDRVHISKVGKFNRYLKWICKK